MNCVQRIAVPGVMCGEVATAIFSKWIEFPIKALLDHGLIAFF
jgi:hypothetical protein